MSAKKTSHRKLVKIWFDKFLSDPLFALVCLGDRDLNLNTSVMDEALDALLAMAED